MAADHWLTAADVAETVAIIGANGATPDEPADTIDAPAETPLHVETWADFARTAQTNVPTLVDELWPECAIGFIAAPPKKGKTWLGLSLAISVATGTPFLGRFPVPHPQPVLLLALEGHRAAIRGRVGCLARGMNIDPDTDALTNLHIAYKPRGLNLTDPAWLQHVQTSVTATRARLLIVDVLRAAARLKENDNTAFSAFLSDLRPLTDDGCSIALLHHFGKLTEITKERAPGERMAGAGAMYGAFDVGVFITGSDDGARRLRIEFETRDIANPGTVGLHLTGAPSGVNGGFVYHDAATWTLQEAPDEDGLAANAIAVRAWLADQPDQSATQGEIALAFDVDPRTITRRRSSYVRAGIEWEPAKASRPVRYWLPPDPRDLQNFQHVSGQEGGQDRVDIVHPQACPPQETLDFQEKPAEEPPGWTRVDNAPCPPPKSGDLQGLSRVDRVDSPTESAPPANAETAPDDANTWLL